MLAEFIQDEMRKRNIKSAREFARLVGVAHTTISSTIDPRNTDKPTMEFLIKLATATDSDLIAVLVMAYPEAASRIKSVDAEARVFAERIEQLPDHIRDAIYLLIRGPGEGR